jgi:hypothetical protein
VADRGVAPVVGKTLELAVAVAFVSLIAAMLYGNLLPQYRTPAANRTTATLRIELPDTIRGEAYRIDAVDSADGPALVLEHPVAGIGGRTRLVLPPSVDAVRGAWESTDRTVVTVRERPGSRRLVLEAAG